MIDRLRERILLCAICMDEYKDPRILPCHHSICLECLEDYIRLSTASGRTFRCPQCRADVCVPRGGVKDFPPNFYLVSIQDEIGARANDVKCDLCDRDWLTSQYRCVDCDLAICRFCIHQHRLFSHDTIAKGIIRTEGDERGNPLTSEKTCQEHPSEPLQMFCNTCDFVICITCACEFHKVHDTISLLKKLHLAGKVIQGHQDRLLAEADVVEKEVERLQTLIESTNDSSERAVELVTAETHRLYDIIRDISGAMLHTIGNDQVKSVEEIVTFKKTIAGYGDQLEKGLHFLKGLREDDTSLELLECFEKFNRGLVQTRKELRNKELRYRTIKFNTGHAKTIGNCMLVKFGTVKSSAKKERFLFTDSNISSLRSYLTSGNILAWVVVTMMIVTIVRQIHMYAHEKSTTAASDILCGLVVYAYLTISFCLAFIKNINSSTKSLNRDHKHKKLCRQKYSKRDLHS